MKHLVRGTAGLVAAIGVLAGCADDPALDLAGAPTRILVNPSFLFIPQGDSQAVLVRTINDLNDAVPAKYEVTNVGAGVSVAFDARYRPDYNNPGDTLAVPELKYQQRYFVKALQPVAASFQVRNGNLSSTINVAVVPDSFALVAGLNKTTAALAEAVTVTAPPTLRFNTNSTVTFDVGGAATVTERAADGTTITFVPQAGSQGTARVSNVTMRYAPAVAGQNIRTTNALTVPPMVLGNALSTTSAAIGAAVTVTAPPALQFSTTSTVTFATGGAAVITARAADGSSITFLPRPGTSGPAVVSNVLLRGAPGNPGQSVTTTNALTVPAVTSIPASFSANTALTPVTMTATGFKFRPDVIVTFGARRAFVVSVAADSNSVQVVLPTGLSGATPTISNAVLPFLTAVALTNLPGSTTVTTAATTTWNGANPDANAPTINAAAAGTRVDFYDTGDINYGADILDNGGPNKWYKVVLPSGGSRTYTVGWTSTADIDFYLLDLAITTAFLSRLTTDNPETGTTNQPAGSYWIGTSNFSDALYPGIVRIRIQ